MDAVEGFADLNGLKVIFAAGPLWPNPANIFAIPDRRGFSMIDVGSGGATGRDYLLNGLNHWGLQLRDLHTVVLSHAHPDHMGAMQYVLEEVHPRVLIHRLDVVSSLEPRHLTETFDIALAKDCLAVSGCEEGQNNFDLLEYFDDLGCSMSAAESVEAIIEGETIQLGDFFFEIVHTPGHSPGHISLFDRDRGLLLAGDLVGNSPAWYTPASGGLIGYLESLDRMESLGARTIVPAHGGILEDAAAAIQKIRGKLLKREGFLRTALQAGPKTFMEHNEWLFPQNPALHFFPGCGITESHLIKMERDGAIRREDGRISLTSR